MANLQQKDGFAGDIDRLYVAVLRAGELSGSLPVVLDALTVYLEKSAQLRRKVLVSRIRDESTDPLRDCF